jgi:membrane associated rhomboid family serine protease
MPRFTVPPITRVLLVLLIVVSTIAAVGRYSAYLFSIREATQQTLADPNVDEAHALSAVYKPSETAIPIFSIVPGVSTFYPWVYITSTFLERTLPPFLVTGAVILFSGRYCEPIWGTVEFGRFVLLLILVPNIALTIFHTLIVVQFTGAAAAAPDSLPTGGVALVAGFLVAFKQMIPEHRILLFKGLVQVKVAWLAAIYLFLYTVVFGLLQLKGFHDAPKAWTGFFVSWIYLRFFRVSYVDPLLPFSNTINNVVLSGSSLASPAVATASSGGIKIKGDVSDTFALNQFFPEPLRSLIKVVSDHLFSALVALRVCAAFDQDEVDASNIRAANRASGGHSYVMSNYNQRRFNLGSGSSSNSSGTPHSTLSGAPSTRAEAERRRALALRMLDESLIKQQQHHPPQPQQQPQPMPDLQVPNRVVLPPTRVN